MSEKDSYGIVVRNTVELTGNKDYVEEAIDALKNNEGNVDFDKIVPYNSDLEDIAMDDYYNAALNVWLKEHNEVNKEDFISTMKFVGLTREYVYNFTELTDTQINVFKSKYKVRKMLDDADKFIDCVKRKSIFNGFFARVSAWGTGNQPMDVRIKGNKIEFITFNTPVLKVIQELSIKFPEVKINYTYIYNDNDNKNTKKELNYLSIKGRDIKIIKNESKYVANIFKIIKDNVAM